MTFSTFFNTFYTVTVNVCVYKPLYVNCIGFHLFELHYFLVMQVMQHYAMHGTQHNTMQHDREVVSTGA